MNKQLSILSAALLAISVSAAAQAAAFTAGDLVIYRVGTGTGSLTSAATAVYLDEYTTAGTLVQSVAMPTSVSGSNHMLTASGTATSEGELTLSTDGKYLVLTGYDAATGTAGIASTTSASVKRTVGVVNVATGVADTSTVLNTFSTNNIRTAVSTNGTDLWVAGANTGVVYTTVGNGGTMTTVSSTITNNRQLEIFGGQLYSSTGSGTAAHIEKVGTGLPTTNQAMTGLTGIPGSGSQYSFFMADLNNNVAGMDTLYVADDTSGTAGGIIKYSLVGGTWVANGQISTGSDAYRGLTGEVVNGQVELFATGLGGSGASGGGKLVTITDTSGWDATINGTATTLVSLGTTNNEAFRGVVYLPNTVAPVPEADSIALMALGMGLVGFLARRRKV